MKNIVYNVIPMIFEKWYYKNVLAKMAILRFQTNNNVKYVFKVAKLVVEFKQINVCLVMIVKIEFWIRVIVFVRKNILKIIIYVKNVIIHVNHAMEIKIIIVYYVTLLVIEQLPIQDFVIVLKDIMILVKKIAIAVIFLVSNAQVF